MDWKDETDLQIMSDLNDIEADDQLDEHFFCPSYPNCDLDPNGCFIISGEDAELYGNN